MRRNAWREQPQEMLKSAGVHGVNNEDLDARDGRRGGMIRLESGLKKTGQARSLARQAWPAQPVKPLAPKRQGSIF